EATSLRTFLEAYGLKNVAERGGFEPPVQETPHNRLATWPVQPLRHLSAMVDAGLLGPLGWGSLKTEERITKASADGPSRRPPWWSRRWFKGLVFVIVIGALGWG